MMPVSRRIAIKPWSEYTSLFFKSIGMYWNSPFEYLTCLSFIGTWSKKSIASFLVGTEVILDEYQPVPKNFWMNEVFLKCFIPTLNSNFLPSGTLNSSISLIKFVSLIFALSILEYLVFIVTVLTYFTIKLSCGNKWYSRNHTQSYTIIS